MTEFVTAKHNTAQHSTAQHSTAQHSTAQHSTAHRNTAHQVQHLHFPRLTESTTAQLSTAQHSTAQHSTAQHSTAQHIFYSQTSLGLPSSRAGNGSVTKAGGAGEGKGGLGTTPAPDSIAPITRSSRESLAICSSVGSAACTQRLNAVCVQTLLACIPTFGQIEISCANHLDLITSSNHR